MSKTWCSITIFVDFNNKTPAGELELRLLDEAATNPEDDSIFRSAPQRLCFAEIEQVGCSVSIHGNVRDTLKEESVLNWLEALDKEQSKCIIIEYHDSIALEYGKYRYENQVLTERKLPDDKYPTIPDSEYQSYFDIVENALKQYGEERLVFDKAA